MAVEDYIAQATSDIEAEKPIKKFVDGVESELTDAEYDIKINKLATVLDDEAQNGYKRARAAAYPSVADFMEAYTEKEIGEDSTKWDAYVIKYNKVRTDNPKE